MSIPYALVFDIGGGSTELIWSKLGQGDSYEIADVLSLPLGVVNLSEHCRTDVIDHDCCETMVHDIARKLPAFCNNNTHQRARAGRVGPNVGDIRNGHNAGRCVFDLPYYSRSRIDGLELNFGIFRPPLGKLTGPDYEGRLPCHVSAGNGLNWLFLAVLFDAICQTVGRQAPVAEHRGPREGMPQSL